MATKAQLRSAIFGSKRAEVRGFKELQAKLSEIANAFGTSSGARTQIAREKQEIMRDAAKAMAYVAQTNARSEGVPARVVRSVFTFTKDRPGKTGALVGVNKQRSMVEWIAAPGNRSPRSKVATGGRVAMSLAAMFERGTSRMRPSPFFTPAVRSMRHEVLRYMATRFKALIEQFGKS